MKRRSDCRADRRADYRVERLADCRTDTRAACRLERRADCRADRGQTADGIVEFSYTMSPRTGEEGARAALRLALKERAANRSTGQVRA